MKNIDTHNQEDAAAIKAMNQVETDLQNAVNDLFDNDESGSAKAFGDILADILEAQLKMQQLGYLPEVIKAHSQYNYFKIYADVVKVSGPCKLIKFLSDEEGDEFVVIENGVFSKFVEGPEEALAA